MVRSPRFTTTTWDGSNWTPATNTTPNLWATVAGDSGSTAANTTSDTLTVAGGEGVDTSMSGDTLTIAGEDASDTNKGIAKFDSGAFTVTSGNVALDNVAISKGGTGASSKEDGMDALSPLSAAGDILTHDGSNNMRLAKGSAGQVLTMNSGATAVEWAASSGGGSSTLIGLTDTPSSLGTAGQVLKVNSGATAVEWATDETGSGGGSSTEVSFFAHRDGVAQSIPVSTDTVVEFDNTDIDENYNFNTGNYNFQVEIAGRYWLTASVSFDDISSTGVQTFIRIRKNGTTIISEGIVTYSGYSDAYLDTACLVDAAQYDYFDVVVWHDDASAVDVHGGKTVTNFQGFKI